MDAWTALVEDLTACDVEEEWFGFKENWFEPTALGEYISALSNAAAMLGRKSAYFVWGVRDSDREVVGTGLLWRRNVGGETLEKNGSQGIPSASRSSSKS